MNGVFLIKLILNSTNLVKKVLSNINVPIAKAIPENINPAIIFKRTCPASMLANNLIPKLKGLDTKDKSSIGTSKKDKEVGEPEGKNKLKKFTLCFLSPINIEPRKTVQENKKVIKTWLVTA